MVAKIENLEEIPLFNDSEDVKKGVTSRLAIHLLITTMTKYTDTFIFSNFHLGSTNWEQRKKVV